MREMFKEIPKEKDIFHTKADRRLRNEQLSCGDT